MSTARIVDALLEAPVVPSFTKIGYNVRRRLEGWTDLNEYNLAGKVILVTGATSGLGKAAARQLASCGATLVLVGRSAERNEQVCAELASATNNHEISQIAADMGDYTQVESVAEEVLGRHERLDVLVHNAGTLSNERQLAPDGTEATVASQVVGPFLLTACCSIGWRLVRRRGLSPCPRAACTPLV